MQNRSNIFLGLLLLTGGVFLLLGNFNLLGEFSESIWGLLFVGGGLTFLAVYAGNRAQWWPLIPGFTLIGIGAIVLLSTAGMRGDWVPSILFLAIGFAFALIYFIKPAENWWAIIPAGTMASIAVMLNLKSDGSAGVFMLGLGGTFVLVYVQGLARKLHDAFLWALIPASIMSVIGLFLLAGSEDRIASLVRLWPLGLIVIGVVMLLRVVFNQRGEPKL